MTTQKEMKLIIENPVTVIMSRSGRIYAPTSVEGVWARLGDGFNTEICEGYVGGQLLQWLSRTTPTVAIEGGNLMDAKGHRFPWYWADGKEVEVSI